MTINRHERSRRPSKRLLAFGGVALLTLPAGSSSLAGAQTSTAAPTTVIRGFRGWSILGR